MKALFVKQVPTYDAEVVGCHKDMLSTEIITRLNLLAEHFDNRIDDDCTVERGQVRNRRGRLTTGRTIKDLQGQVRTRVWVELELDQAPMALALP